MCLCYIVPKAILTLFYSFLFLIIQIKWIPLSYYGDSEPFTSSRLLLNPFIKFSSLVIVLFSSVIFMWYILLQYLFVEILFVHCFPDFESIFMTFFEHFFR